MKFLKLSVLALLTVFMVSACKSSKKTSVSQKEMTARSLYKRLKSDLKSADVSRMGDTVRVVYPEIAMFDFGKSQIKSESLPSFQRFALVMKEYPTIHFMINGYTDNVGTDDVNTELSAMRAKAGQKILSDYGVDAMRMMTNGYGSANPTMSNTTDQGRQANRRVEFLLYIP